MSTSVGVFKLHDGGETFSAPRPVAKKPVVSAKPNGSGRAGPARRMQAGLATALKAEQEF
jgi:methyl-accepting chemotaxis protein